MSINIEAFRKDKDYICVYNKLYTMEEYIERVDILEAQIEELKAKNERLRIRIKELERIAKVTPKEEQCEDVGYSPDGRPGLRQRRSCRCLRRRSPASACYPPFCGV